MIEKSAEYSFDQIQIGTTKTFTVKISESLVGDFAKLSGDFNPLHMDEQYAKKTLYKNRICHGFLIASFFSQLIGMHLPGKSALYLSQTLNFELPCFINDEIVIEGRVIDKSISTNIITIKTTAFNSQKKVVVDGIAKVIVRQS